MFKGFSQCMPTVSIHYFGLFNPFHYSLLLLYLLPPPIFQQFSTHVLISYTFTDAMSCDIFDALSVSSFPSFPEFHMVVHMYKHVVHMSLYTITLFWVYMFILWIYVQHMRENIWPLPFPVWLTSLNMMSSSCTYLPSNHIVTFIIPDS
jgi:hypothetical protein